MSWFKRFLNLEHNEFWEKPKEEKVDPILEAMEKDGYSYDQGNEWWVRTWTTNQGKETIREIYQQLENGKWNKLMIGYGDRVFYEEEEE
jgi:DNA-binding PadR family transcriptional regulator